MYACLLPEGTPINTHSLAAFPLVSLQDLGITCCACGRGQMIFGDILLCSLQEAAAGLTSDVLRIYKGRGLVATIEFVTMTECCCDKCVLFVGCPCHGIACMSQHVTLMSASYYMTMLYNSYFLQKQLGSSDPFSLCKGCGL